LIPNPYESTAQPSATVAGCRTHWYRIYLVPVSQIAFWFGTMLFVLGSFISFYPGAEPGWFGMSAALVGFGFFVPSKSYRIATLMIAAVGRCHPQGD
jgi:hypothetical protein